MRAKRKICQHGNADRSKVDCKFYAFVVRLYYITRMWVCKWKALRGYGPLIIKMFRLIIYCRRRCASIAASDLVYRWVLPGVSMFIRMDEVIIFAAGVVYRHLGGGKAGYRCM